MLVSSSPPPRPSWMVMPWASPNTMKFMEPLWNCSVGIPKHKKVWKLVISKVLMTAVHLANSSSMKEQLLDEGADIIMPVAGPVGLGTLAAMADRNTGLLIGVDNDWSVANPDKAAFILGSALKKIDVFVYDSVKQVVDGTFKGGEVYQLTLENQGVGLAYGSEWESQVPAELKAEIEALIPGIVSGEIATVPAR
ncbi:MAG: hypothetical protein CVU42_16640 [Chloroflexi bacterium HGW-Chloroflexi-4]|nr:MAG: hypothetical protein CVU42_16640 [Chloroflexi bacterium HGW-Chloroflexi-4]